MLNELQLKRFKSPIVLTLPCVTLSLSLIEDLLSINTNNIPPVKSKISLYADLMLKGEWKYNGDSIRISSTGVLLDGQNRLKAAKKANLPLTCDLIFGLDDSVFGTIDQGRVRNRGHILSRELGSATSITEANMINTAISKIIKHDLGYSQNTANSAKFIVTSEMAYEYVINNICIIEQASFVKNKFGSRALLPQPTILYIYHICSRFDEKYAKAFLNKMVLGINLDQNETLYHANQILIKLKSKSTKWTKGELENSIIKVWNSVARSGLYSIKHANNIKSRQDESHTTFNPASSQTKNEMFGLKAKLLF